MKSLRKKILAMASVVALSGLMMASVAGAAATDKLKVMDATGTNTVFKVDDSGTITATGFFKVDPVSGKAGLNTINPLSSFHMVDTGTTAARGLIVAQHNGDSVTWSTGYHAANIVLRKSRGAETTGFLPVMYDTTNGGDYIATIHAQAWDGSAWQNGASFAYRIDGPVSTGNTPTSLSIYTGNNAPGKKINLHVASNGNVGMGTTAPAQKLEVNGGVRLNTATAKPTCDANARGTLWFTNGGAGKDTLEVCAQDAGAVLGWRTLY